MAKKRGLFYIRSTHYTEKMIEKRSDVVVDWDFQRMSCISPETSYGSPLDALIPSFQQNVSH